MKTKTLVLLFIITCLLISCAPLRLAQECDVKSMLLSEDDFPKGTVLDNDRSSVAEMPEASAGFTSSYNDSSMYHKVGRFPWIESAENYYNETGKSAFISTKYEGPWETPAEITYKSAIFQKYHVACATKLHGKYQCRMIGQYDEYYVFFFAYISNEGVTLEILNDLLQKIDARMAKCAQQ